MDNRRWKQVANDLWDVQLWNASQGRWVTSERGTWAAVGQRGLQGQRSGQGQQQQRQRQHEKQPRPKNKGTRREDGAKVHCPCGIGWRYASKLKEGDRCNKCNTFFKPGNPIGAGIDQPAGPLAHPVAPVPPKLAPGIGSYAEVAKKELEEQHAEAKKVGNSVLVAILEKAHPELVKEDKKPITPLQAVQRLNQKVNNKQQQVDKVFDSMGLKALELKEMEQKAIQLKQELQELKEQLQQAEVEQARAKGMELVPKSSIRPETPLLACPTLQEMVAKGDLAALALVEELEQKAKELHQKREQAAKRQAEAEAAGLVDPPGGPIRNVGMERATPYGPSAAPPAPASRVLPEEKDADAEFEDANDKDNKEEENLEVLPAVAAAAVDDRAKSLAKSRAEQVAKIDKELQAIREKPPG